MSDGDVTDLRERAHRLELSMHGITAAQGDTNAHVRLLGRGHEEILQGISRLDRVTRHSVWNMQRWATVETVGTYEPLNVPRVKGGLDSRMVVSLANVKQVPLLLGLLPHLRVAPVFMPLIVVDRIHAVLPGAPTEDGLFTAWFVTRPDLCRQALDLWNGTWQLGQAAQDLPGIGPRLTERQYGLVRMWIAGYTDASIARRIGLSVRTINAESARVQELLGAKSRIQAIAILTGSAAASVASFSDAHTS